MMTRTGKVWGWTSPIWQTANASASLIHITRGAWCSEHRHIAKYNQFINLSEGRLLIMVWQDKYNLVDTTVLRQYESTTVKPGLYHKFMAEDDILALEFYWSECLDCDIERRTVGGKLKI